MAQVNLSQHERRSSIHSFVARDAEMIDVADGKNLYEILDSAKSPVRTVKAYEYYLTVPGTDVVAKDTETA